MELGPFSLVLIAATIFYACLGVCLMVLFLVFVDKVFKLDLKKELVEDENVAYGIMIAGVAIGISIILAASIV